MIEQAFFGHPESPLFGVYHQPRGSSAHSQERAALVCPPIGQEYNRSHWTLRLLANQVARKGVHVLRMDYHGIGDSAQSVDQIDTLEAWQRNIECSIDFLKRKTSAETVLLIGHRFGAALASQVAMKRPDVNGVVLWEPVLDGFSYLAALRKMHEQMLDFWVCKMTTPSNDSVEEILGSLYSRSLLDEIESLKINLSNMVQPQLVAQSALVGQHQHPEPGMQYFIEETRPESWYELNDLEAAWLRPETLRQLVKKIAEMFERLDRFDALSDPSRHRHGKEAAQ